MTTKELLEERISKGLKQLEVLKKKKENLELNIFNLEAKIRNQ
jgi:hypothetical protein